ncbi:MAG: hypothetical protein JSV03_02310 [Planctomycetota bacterium]|nr:MAG: hypothetical protein JSV03_02310 [Planctomycetota bacterium]
MKWILPTTLFVTLVGPYISSVADARIPAKPAKPASYVCPIDLEKLAGRLKALPRRERELIKLYMEAARRDVLKVTDGCYPDKGFREHCRNLAERAKGAAVLSSFAAYWPEDFRKYCRREAQAMVREVAFAHRQKPNFGYEWQAAYWAAEAAIAAWFMWDELDADLQQAVARMVVYQADRFIGVKPKMNYQGNTQAETVSWNSTVCTLAVNMMPGHPHNADWDKAAKIYLYNTFATPTDASSESIGDDDKPVKEWIVGANIYDDFALENHNQFHIDYIFACYRFHIQGAALYWLTGRNLPHAFRHHARDMYDQLMLRCMNHDGFFVYVSDNDWQRYHNWTESTVLHAYMALMERHQLAPVLEERALRKAVDYWRSFPPGFSYHNQYCCGKAWTSRIADAVLLHITCPHPRVVGLPRAEVEKELRGTFEVKSAKLLTHYADDGSFRSYFWGRGRWPVRFVAPKDDSWMVLPVGLNYRGSIKDKPILHQGNAHWDRGRDWFWAVREQASGGVAEAFISLPIQMVIYMERIPAARLTKTDHIENAIAVEKAHRTFAIHFDGGRAVYEVGQSDWKRDDGGDDPKLGGNWVNLQDRIGYVVANVNDNLKHQIILPKTGIRDALRIHSSVSNDADHNLCIVTCPNQNHETTAKIASKIRVFASDAVTSCVISNYVVAVNFSPQKAQVVLHNINDAALIELDPWRVGVWRAGKKLF